MAEHNRKNPDALMTQDEGIAFKPEGYEKYGRNKEGKPKDSYEAGYPNVSILERMNLKRRATDKAVSVYVEGIGTQDNLGDDLPGNMFGILKTGIKNKVQIGVGRLAKGIVKVLKQISGRCIWRGRRNLTPNPSPQERGARKKRTPT